MDEKQDIVLFSLKEILKNNTQYTVQIENIKNKKSKKYIEKIKKYLKSEGLDENRIIIEKPNDPVNATNLQIKFLKGF